MSKKHEDSQRKETLLKQTANEYSTFLPIDTTAERAGLDRELESMLTRLEEYGTLLERTRSESRHVAEVLVPQVYSYYQTLQRTFQTVDQLEALVVRVKSDLTTMEDTVAKAEADLGLSQGFTTVIKPLFFKREQIPARLSAPDPASFQAPEIFNAEDYFAATTSNTSTVPLSQLELFWLCEWITSILLQKMMHMSFYFSSTVYDFLFPGVNIVTTWAMVSLCLGLVTLSILVEGFKVARTQLFKLSLAYQDDASVYHIPQRSPSSLPSWCCCSYEGSSIHRVKFHVLQSFLHVVHLTLGYILMLVVMTYNVYFAFAVIGGAGLGYFFFALFDLPGKILGAGSSSNGDKRGLHNTSTRTEVLPLQSTEGPTTHVNSHLVCGKNCSQYKEKKVLDSKINGH
ncbi:hypothetical protein Pmani_012027 [Petrolisthes manimaculis]|uniref:Copper transport protein n=1 Tax=Petrolisthes manimaculis TaxID=1843537 RepID=A0AAE1UDP4_9EUCA|nr:hypothetical protein Pmani_012027 [Petrolisthes manimaculis]